MLVRGDCLIELSKMDSNSIDSLVTDPPAGISFMGKAWDSGNNFIPAMTEIFKECLRVMKPGAHGLVWALPRTSHWTATALEQAGFEIRDVVTHLFGSGFPKSHNLGNGWGTALKPASEHWMLIRKPCSEKTVAQNVLKWGTGGINIDGCRIESECRPLIEPNRKSDNVNTYGSDFCGSKSNGKTTQGRFPSNLVLDEEAAKMLDEQSGILKSGGGIKNPIGGALTWKKSSNHQDSGYQEPSVGGASRFFYCAKASKKDRNEGCEELPEQSTKHIKEFPSGGITAGKGSEQRGSIQHNHHPTVKSTKLMEYLITLVTPPNGIVLDPFMGSGSTGKAAIKLGFKFIGIEKEQEYFEIAEKRCKIPS